MVSGIRSEVSGSNDAGSDVEAPSPLPIRSDSTPAGRAPLIAAAAVLFSVAVFAFFWLIHSDTVDMLRADQWYDVRLIQRSDTGTLSFGTLWAQHAENRIFFQNLITLVLAHTTHFNVLVEDYLTGVLLVASTAIVIWTHRSRSTSTPWIAYAPVAFLMLSLVQSGVTLYGFEIGWALIMLALAVTLYLLDRPILGNLPLALAIAAAVVGSFSSLQGLLIWPTGLALLYQRRRPMPKVAVWIAYAVVATVLYFINWSPVTGGNSTSYVFSHPIPSIKFFLVAIGDVVGVPLTDTSGSADLFVELLGIVIVASAIATIFVCGFRRDESSGSPIGVSLIWFGLLFATMITGARASLGVSGAVQSRYATFDLLILVGMYLAIIGRPRATVMASRALQVLGVVVIGAICLQVILGNQRGNFAMRRLTINMSSREQM